MMPLVIKLGGVLLDNAEAMTRLFNALSECCRHSQRPVAIVHGGGCMVDQLMAKLSLPVIRRNGLRVTPVDQIDTIVGALAGSANKILLAAAKKSQLNPIGLCLADGDMVKVTQLSETLGHVGEASPGQSQLLNLLSGAGYLPVISSIGITDDGVLMNVNADHAATAIAAAWQADLLLLSDVSGILGRDGLCITELSFIHAEQLIAEGVITDGMVVKVNAAFDAARQLMRPVTVASWHNIEQLSAWFNHNGANDQVMGTRIVV